MEVDNTIAFPTAPQQQPCALLTPPEKPADQEEWSKRPIVPPARTSRSPLEFEVIYTPPPSISNHQPPRLKRYRVDVQESGPLVPEGQLSCCGTYTFQSANGRAEGPMIGWSEEDMDLPVVCVYDEPWDVDENHVGIQGQSSYLAVFVKSHAAHSEGCCPEGGPGGNSANGLVVVAPFLDTEFWDVDAPFFCSFSGRLIWLGEKSSSETESESDDMTARWHAFNYVP